MAHALEGPGQPLDYCVSSSVQALDAKSYASGDQHLQGHRVETRAEWKIGRSRSKHCAPTRGTTYAIVSSRVRRRYRIPTLVLLDLRGQHAAKGEQVGLRPLDAERERLARQLIQCMQVARVAERVVVLQ